MTDNTYRPEHPEYRIGEKYAAYPQELEFGGDTPDAVIKAAMEQLIAESSKENVWRKLDETEIETLRDEYTSLMEKDKLASEARISELAAEEYALKEKMKSAKEAHQSIMQHINDNVRTIKEGVIYESLDPNRSLRIALDGHYLHYTVAYGKLVLAKVEPIPSDGQGSIFTRQTRNQEVFIRMFGCQFTPSDTFEQIDMTPENAPNVAGRKLAAAAVHCWAEDFVDEDTGTIVTVDRQQELVTRDTELTSEQVNMLIEEGVESVVVYKVQSTNDAPTA